MDSVSNLSHCITTIGILAGKVSNLSPAEIAKAFDNPNISEEFIQKVYDMPSDQICLILASALNDELNKRLRGE